MLRSVELQDYILRNPIKVGLQDDIYEVIHKILVHKVSGVCVVDEQDNLLGILSELDCMKAILSSVYNESGSHVGTAAEFMTSDVISVTLDDNIVDVAADMLKHKHRRRPVLQDGKLIGLVTCRQLLKAVQKFATP